MICHDLWIYQTFPLISNSHPWYSLADRALESYVAGSGFKAKWSHFFIEIAISMS